MTYYSILKTAELGELLLVATETHLGGIYFADRGHAPAVEIGWVLDVEQRILRQAAAELREYVEGERREFSVPLKLVGTEFQEEVWRQIARIPFGETITYSELAQRVGAAKAVRAAGSATGRNPLSIVVPCHRVVGKDGAITGYAGGVERKQWLLALERGAVTQDAGMKFALTA